MKTPLDPAEADRLARATRTLATQFRDLATHLAAVWVYRLLPSAEEVQELARNRRILLEDGSEAELRRVALPALSYDCSRRLGELMEERLAEGADWDQALIDAVGPEFAEELRQEAETSHRWHVEVAELSRWQIALTAFLALDALHEKFLGELRGQLCLRGQSSSRDRRALVAPIAHFVGVRDLDELDLPGAAIATAIRLVANDVKHHGGHHHRSSELLERAVGSQIRLDAADIVVWAGELAKYFEALSEVVEKRIWSFAETA